MPSKAMLLVSRWAILLTVAAALHACFAHRSVVEKSAGHASHTAGSSIGSSLKITALSLPPEPDPYDRIEVNLKNPNLPDRVQSIESYKLNTAIPIKPHKNYILTVHTYAGDEVLYSSEYCSKKKTFRSQLGPSLLTISLCEPPDVEDEEIPANPTENTETTPTPSNESPTAVT